MELTFWYKLGLSFMVGGAWVTMSTLAAERYGSKIGGLIGGLPSTVVVTLLFIGLTQATNAASEATLLVPLAMGINGYFIIVFILTAKRGLLLSLSSALLTWLILASLLVAIHIQHFYISIVGWIILTVVCILIVERWLNVASQEKVRFPYTPSQIILRGLFGGAIIAFAVLMGRLAGPVYGGIFATFPAIFTSTLVITYRTAGAEFSQAVARSLMISGMINVPLYAIMARYLLPWSGLLSGTAIALVLAYGSGYLTYLFMRARS